MEDTTMRNDISQKKNLIGLAVSFFVGLVIGLVVLGWWLWPVHWINAAPQHLRQDYKQDYLVMAIEAYAQTHDAAAAQRRFEALGPDAEPLLATLKKYPPKGITPQEIKAFESAVKTQSTAKPSATSAAGKKPIPTKPPVSGHKKGSSMQVILLLCGVGVLVLVAVAIGFYLLKHKTPKEPATAAQRAEALRSAAKPTDFSEEGLEDPIAQIMTTYVHGDDLYDDSHSIDAPNGDFLGECGVSIADTVGFGEPKKATALEVWLFDKNDVQTVTKVLMTEKAFNDPATQQRLAAKGDPIMAEPDGRFVMETEHLRMVVRVNDMAYGEDESGNQYFERVTLELSVWPKENEQTA